MENVNTRIFAFGPARFAFDLNLPDERGDGLDGVRHGEESHQRQARVRQARMNALTDSPDLGFAGQSCESLDRIIGHHLIKLAHQSLVGTEHDRANRTGNGLSFPFCNQGRRPAFPEACAQPQFHSAIVVGQRAHRFLVLSDARGGHGLHRANDGLEISGTVDLSAQARRGVAHDFFSGSDLGLASFWTSGLDPGSGLGSALASGLDSGLGWKRASDLLGDFDNRFAILVAQFFGGFQSLAHLRRDIRRRLA